MGIDELLRKRKIYPHRASRREIERTLQLADRALADPVLPHHRTYGSVYGGSRQVRRWCSRPCAHFGYDHVLPCSGVLVTRR
jgi:hypothetical protein